ncbi:MAG: RNA polymerase sigma factor [Oscillospiraceae bacterium]|jgi:RNA polymerase sigma-70 factor (ECF subfamily)|nr:RNA polymerase sigma factor [Oscillospiraceae bacterium]
MQGDSDFERIYIDYFEDVFRYTLALTRNDLIADEITAETFFKALKKADSFDGRCDIRTWLFQIAKNTYFSELRKNKRQVEDDMLENVASDCVIDTAFEDKETALRIHKILHQMEDPYKEVFTLRVFGELSFSQIAEVFGKTESWARVTYHRAKGKIINNMKE